MANPHQKLSRRYVAGLLPPRRFPSGYIAKQKFDMANGYWTVTAGMSIVDRLPIQYRSRP
jgi:hypothetical protein